MAFTRETAVEKYDVKVAQKALYSPPAKQFTVVDVPRMQYLAVDGHGDPNTAPEHASALEALYGVAYAVKFESKNVLGRDLVVGPLEGLWRADDPAAFTSGDKGSWDWTMLISQPEWINSDLVTAMIAKVGKKKALDALGTLRLLTLDEGRSVQTMHHGPYDDEAPILAELHDEYLPAHGLTFNGDHHEIYLSDARRTAPARLKTILRQPVKPS